MPSMDTSRSLSPLQYDGFHELGPKQPWILTDAAHLGGLPGAWHLKHLGPHYGAPGLSDDVSLHQSMMPTQSHSARANRRRSGHLDLSVSGIPNLGQTDLESIQQTLLGAAYTEAADSNPSHHHHRLPDQGPPSKMKRYEGEGIGQIGMPLPARTPLKKRRWTRHEEEHLINLKEKQGLTWKQVAESFPEKSPGALQVHYSKHLQVNTDQWTDRTDQKLRTALNNYENKRWHIVAKKVQSGFTPIACQERAKRVLKGGVEGEYYSNLPDQGPPSNIQRHEGEGSLSGSGGVGGAPSVVGQSGMPSPAQTSRWPRLKYTPNDELLVGLKEKQGLTWKQVAKSFPGKSPGALQAHYSKHLQEKKDQWTEGTDKKLRTALNDYENDKWRIVANKVGIAFTPEACKERAQRLLKVVVGDEDDSNQHPRLLDQGTQSTHNSPSPKDEEVAYPIFNGDKDEVPTEGRPRPFPCWLKDILCDEQKT